MAIFYDYIKGINKDMTTITKIYFSPTQDSNLITSQNYPVIRLYDTEGLIKEDLGEIITSEGPSQQINYLKCDTLEINNLKGTPMITSTGDIVVGSAADTTENKLATGEVVVYGTIEAPTIHSDNVTLTNATIETNTIITNTTFTNGTIKFGTSSLSYDGILTVNKINFIKEEV